MILAAAGNNIALKLYPQTAEKNGAFRERFFGPACAFGSQGQLGEYR